MNVYLISTDASAPHGSLIPLLDEFDAAVEELRISASHEAIVPLLKDRDPGIVFLPPLWEDLFCVKVLNDMATLNRGFETVIVGAHPVVSNLVAAFNAGLSAFVELPINHDLFRTVMQRVRERLVIKIGLMHSLNRLEEFEEGKTPSIFSPQVVERDRLLANAFMDLINRNGPLLEGSVQVLLVSSSEAQHQRFNTFLRKIGIRATSAGTMQEALKHFRQAESFSIVITDNLLPDGDATQLVNEMRKILRSEMPRIIALTASPDKVAELLRPDTHIDDVIIKPGPGAEIESVLPSLIAGIYQVR